MEKLYWFILFLSVTIPQLPSTSRAIKLIDNEALVTIQTDHLSLRYGLDNSSPNDWNGIGRIELLDTDNKVRSSVTLKADVPLGHTNFNADLPIAIESQNPSPGAKIMWWRIRITLLNAAGIEILSRTLSLSEITPGLFELRVSAREETRAQPYVVRVLTTHPIKQNPIAGVKVSATLLKDDKVITRLTGLTSAEGLATFNFGAIPTAEPDAELDLEVEASRDGFTDSVEKTVKLNQFAHVYISQDKPIYQPGQSFHARLLAVSRPLNHAIPGAAGEFEIRSPDGEKVYVTKFTTNEYGVASIDWNISDGLRLGRYSVTTSLDGYEKTEGYEGFNDRDDAGFNLSRYELPNFEVKVTTDRDFYLSDQAPVVTITAQYLFGKPVTHGAVRVVREDEREWDYKNQKWNVTEKDKYEGKTDVAGQFVVNIKRDEEFLAATQSVSKDQAWQESANSRYHDFHYAAYFTDETTGRTEQRRFDLRATSEPIHINILSMDNSLADGLPLKFYLYTCRADGTPVSATVDIKGRYGNLSARIQTNRLGLAKYVSPDPIWMDKVRAALPEGERDNARLWLKAVARDQQGNQGQLTSWFSLGYNRPSRLTTDRSLYQAGQSIRATLESSISDDVLFVDVLSHSQLVQTLRVALSDHRAEFIVPYNSEFSGEVSLMCYRVSRQYEGLAAAQAVLFPSDQKLALKVNLPQLEFRPNSQAGAKFAVTDSHGKPIQAALGINVIDRAIEVRAATDTEFGGGSNKYFADVMREALDQVGGVSFGELTNLDPRKQASTELDLAAEVKLLPASYSRYYYYPGFADRGGNSVRDYSALYSDYFANHRSRVTNALARFRQVNERYPRDDAELNATMLEGGIDLLRLPDPWGNPYRARFWVNGAQEGFSLLSNGPDQQPGTDDDFTVADFLAPYFTHTEWLIREAVEDYQRKTGRVVSNEAELKGILSDVGIDFGALRDKWGRPYRAELISEWRYLAIRIVSDGPDPVSRSGSFAISNIRQDLGAGIAAKLAPPVYGYYREQQKFPSNLAELTAALRTVGIDYSTLKDALGRKLYATFRQDIRYGQTTLIDTGPEQHRKVLPVVRYYTTIDLRTVGADGIEGTWDDYTVATFSQLVSEEQRLALNSGLIQDDQKIDPAAQSGDLARMDRGNGGIVKGVVIDQNGAVITEAFVKATKIDSGGSRTTHSEYNGQYVLDALPPGRYTLTVAAVAFKTVTVTDVYIAAGESAIVDVTLSVGTITETVEITSSQIMSLNASSSDVSSTVNTNRATQTLNALFGGNAGQGITPRLRKYFPENLLWQPMLETDKQGHAKLEFKLADTITDWKLAVIGSTKDGRIGTAEVNIRAFQPFFVEPDVPQVLTEGDEISLPVVVRNYTDTRQQVKLSLTPAPWQQLMEASDKLITAPAGDSSTEHFRLKAIAAGEQKERVTGVSMTDSETGDAVEKPTLVHPDGEELVQTMGDLLSNESKFEFAIPDYALLNGRRAMLKLYPNLFAQALEGIEGNVQRPHGCGEQTISSAYPNLLVLQYLKRSGKSKPQIESSARHNLQLGYDKVVGYIAPDGGMTYWGGSDADLALTAYALQFLADAREFINVDPTVLERFQTWLVNRQAPNGSWVLGSTTHYKEYKDGAPRLTAYIASVLAKSALKPAARLSISFDYLERANRELADPYVIALTTLAELAAGSNDKAIAGAQQLEKMSLTQEHTRFWNFEANTPFYGWGRAGRVETTAIVLEALVRTHRLPEWAKAASDQSQTLVNQGLLFLTKEKDRYGVWYSGQATVRVLQSIIALSDEQRSAPASQVTIKVNGHSEPLVTLPAGAELTGCLFVDVARFLRPGQNVIELARNEAGPAAAVQLIESHYVPWSQAESVHRSGDLRLSVKLNKTEAKAGESITYSVEAERVAFRGYGMMLAEIGLPPGGEVDRASLEKAIAEGKWELWRYDVLPDRAVFYLWPRAGGTKFNFDVKLRYPIRAKLAPSLLYDYYNPEARATVEPTLLSIH